VLYVALFDGKVYELKRRRFSLNTYHTSFRLLIVKLILYLFDDTLICLRSYSFDFDLTRKVGNMFLLKISDILIDKHFRRIRQHITQLFML
jgi:hypothetical protein